MIEQKGFNFTEEFFQFLPPRQQGILRRISAAIKDERVIWGPGAQTFLVLDCLADERYLDLAENQISAIEAKLLEKPNGPVTVSRKDLTKTKLTDTVLE